MKKNTIITIGRQLGSGGIIVASKLAEKLNFDLFDKEILYIAAQKSGIGEEFFTNIDEKKKFDFLGRFFPVRSTAESDIWNNNNLLSADSLFKIQSEIIKDIANTKSAVIVGRCADYILRNNINCFNIFLSADINDRIERIALNKNTSKQKAELIIEKTDKIRANYYNYYTNKKWGYSISYHLCLNTSYIGIYNCVDIIIEVLKKNKLII